MLLQFMAGLVLAAATSYGAYHARSLTRRGTYAATVLGTLVFGLGGWQWATLLLAFFIPSSTLTRAFRPAKQGLEHKYEKSGQRDDMQVLSNGGPAAVFVLLHALFPQAAWPWIGFAGALAAVSADTWATELGVLSPGRPRMITALRRTVEKGTSGGVSIGGTLASFLGGALIAMLAALLGNAQWPVFVAVSLAGLIGSLADSLLGATIQAVYLCPLEKKETEQHPFHTCGTETRHIRGWKWVGNDLVNVACGIAGALAALVLSILR